MKQYHRTNEATDGNYKGERGTVGLLNTHTGSKHTNTTSALSFPANMSL